MDEVVLFADFDSANMARYERVVKTPASLLNSILSGQYSGGNQKTTSSSSSNNNSNNANSNTNATDKENSDNSVITNQFVTQKYDYEFNVWTRADCEDSSVGANSNRTWFYFGVRGGQGKFIKFNIMNMNKQNKLFEMGMLPVFKTIPGHEKWARIYLKPIWQTVDQNFMMSFIHRIPDKKDSVTYFAFCFPFSYEECQSMLKKYDQQFDYCRRAPSFDTKCDPDQIYYHRELFTETLDKRRVDLITVSSYHQIIYRREPRFDPDHLFPDPNNPRPFRFDKKRVYVLTSRVHPGETPSSFVFNGFLEFILRSQDPRARILRRQFVFKLIPLLNPDGVARGYYRTDQLGVNLNRVYLDPNPTLHPSIYAAKSLLVYHHIYNRSSRELDGLNFDHVFKLRFDVDDQELIDQPNPSNDIIYTDEPTLQGHSVLKDDDDIITPSTSSLSPSWPHQQNHLVLNKISSSTSARNQNNVLLIESNRFPSTTNRSLDINNFFSSTERTHASNTTKSNKSNSIGTNLTRSLDFLVRTHTETMMKRDAVKVIGEKRIGNENSDEEEGEQGEPLTAKTTGPTSMSTNPFDTNINSPHLNDPKLLMINPLWSGVAFYVDLHGHAGKRGCFIYGNSIDNELYQVENVLFARLIAFSSQHFDFDGCNFSVKNMYMRDKGCQSKEGSGRVAMYKVLGLIHSYTLECSYSSGRVMNNLAPAINTSGPTYYINGTRCQYVSGSVSPPLHNDLPPKFLQEHYADVGKGLAIAALDLIEMNPHTRIPNTSFGSLEAVRNWVKFYIRSRIGGGISVATSGLQPANSASSAALSNSNSSNALPVNIVSSASSGALNNASSNVAKKSFVNQKSNPQRLSANQSQKSMSQQSKSNNSSSSTLTSLSKVSSNSSNLNKLKPQTRKSLTPQQEIMTTKATITTTTIAPPNTTILDRSKMVSQRRSLGKLIMEYESMEKTQVAEIAAGAENIDTSTVSSNGSGGGKTSTKPTSASSTHKTSMFHTMFSAISEPPVREPTNVVNSGGNQSTKSDSSISSSETVKPNISNTPETNIKPLEESREKKTSKDRFKLRKPMSISKASVLSNTTTTTATNNQPDVISSLMMDQPMTGRSSVATVRNMAAAYANIMPTSTTKQPNSLPNTMRLKTSQAALSRGFTALEPAQFFAPAKSSPATSSSSKAISEPIVYLSLNKLLNKNKASDNEHRRSYQQQSSMVLKTSGIETIKLKRK